MNVIFVKCIKKIHSFIFNIRDESTQTIRIPMMAMSKKIIRCIGKCSSGLKQAELDMITDHVLKTLDHCKGRSIFKNFLHEGNRIDDLACLEFYEKICEYIDKDEIYLNSTTEPTLVGLTASLNEILEIAVDLNGIPEIDMALLERFTECLTNPSRVTMLDVLAETKYRLADHLRNAHNDFKHYLLQPCPKTN
ncbi:hypothetical protein PV328_006502 [Microctonus aethiopoides]|uniref:Uncharacterized protein n=1 Tax=Microctonus aethiopoides TaxID=144406 RepID=A0AA39FPQ1_9HYME|nr:hypothetical protein PV328_006502 [Microctonus aethiopoides]